MSVNCASVLTGDRGAGISVFGQVGKSLQGQNNDAIPTLRIGTGIEQRAQPANSQAGVSSSAMLCSVPSR